MSARRERRLALWLCAPAVTVMAAVTAYPLLYAVWLSLQRYDLRFPAQRTFVGLDNYLSVLGSAVWWQALSNTAVLTLVSVTLELLLGMALALLMQRALLGRQLLRTVLLVPYGIITVVAALAWKFAFDPTVGFVNGLLGLHQAWLTEHWSAMAVIVLTELWKTTPFMALLLLAGLTQVPRELLHAARVDGANAVQRFVRITLPLLKPTLLVALLFRTLDAFRIFDTVFIQTRGSVETETVSVLGYDALVVRLNLGLGAAVSVLIFLCVVMIATAFVKGLGAPLGPRR